METFWQPMGSRRALNVTVENAKIKFSYDVLLPTVSIRVPAEDRWHIICWKLIKGLFTTQ